MRFLIVSMFAITAVFANQVTHIAETNTLEILNPDMQERKVAKIRLQNGLEALIISDPNVDESAASLSVEAGSFHDWKGYDGIAHFTEHLVFMGSEKYPDEAEFSKFVRDHSGLSNAYTSSVATVFAFKCTHDGFSGALDRFSHFFIDPTFNESGVARELIAVDQEHTKNLESDEWREWMILKDICNPKHPITKFSTGNSKTLGHIPRDKVVEWYRTHYSADRMHLVVTSSRPVDELINLVEECFSQVPNSEPVTYADVPIFAEKHKGNVVYIEPVRDLRTLTVLWEIQPDDTYKSEQVLARLINAKTKGSLYAKLKEEGLIEEIHAGSDRLSKSEAMFMIGFDLTRDGIDKKDRVLDLTFAYLSHLSRNPVPSYVYNEMHQMRIWNYAFASRGDVFNTAMNQAHALVYEPLSSYPMRSILPKEYNSKAYTFRLQEFKADDCMVVLQAPSELTGVYPEQREKWNRGEYALRKMPKERIDDLNEIALSDTFSLPVPSSYIPTSLSTVCEKSSNKNPLPQLVVDEPFGRLYYFKDQRFCTPKIATIYGIRSSSMGTDAFTQALLDLYVYSVNEAIASEQALAAQAGLYGGLTRELSTMLLTIDGYEERSAQLLKTYLHTMKNVKVSKEQFKLYYQAVYSNYEIAAKPLPVLQSLESYKHLLYNDYHPAPQMLSALKEIEYDDFIKFQETLFEKTHVEALTTGSVEREEAIFQYSMITRALKSSPFPSREHLKERVLSLPDEGGPFQLNMQSRMQGNGCLLAIEAAPFTFDHSASHAVLTGAMSNDFFEELRTKQQTGYIAQAVGLEKRGKLIFLLLTQSGTHQAGELIARFELFLENYARNLPSQISQERFEKLRTSSIDMLAKPARNLSETASLYYGLAYQREGNFEHKNQQIKALEALSYEKFLEDAKSYISRSNGKRLAVLVEGKPVNDKSFRYQRTSQDLLRQTGRYVTAKSD